MRFALVCAAMSLCMIGLFAQSTLKIFVATDDPRSDMAIIDLNTSAFNTYGRSVDSTNINTYSTTMSTQVIRMKYEDLYPSDDGEQVEFAEMVLSDTDEKRESQSVQIDKGEGAVIPDEILRENNTSKPFRLIQDPVKKVKTTQSERILYSSRTFSKTLKKTRSKHQKNRRNKKYRKYKNQCPKFF